MKKIIVITLTLLTSLILVSCTSKDQFYSETLFGYMFSHLEVKLGVSSEEEFDNHMEEIEAIYQEIDIIANYNSAPNNNSLIINNIKTINDQMSSSANEFETFEINKTFYEMLELADELRIMTNNYFNVGMGYHIKIWKNLINQFKEGKLSEDEKDALVTTTTNQATSTPILEESYLLEIVDNKYYVKVYQGVLLDFGAFAKGYGTKKVVDYIESKNITYYSVDGGSSALSYGLNMHKDRNYYNIGFKDPYDSNINYAILSNVKNLNIATSGSYEAFNHVDYKENRYHHIISAKTGLPVNKYLTVTMVGNDASHLDPLTTAIFAMDETEIITFIKDNDLEIDYALYKMDGSISHSFNNEHNYYDLEFKVG